ncbi:MAG: EamA family transporter [Bacteroidetes bacterium]|nr:EamA family transporter [Bacteroidota bacterium]
MARQRPAFLYLVLGLGVISFTFSPILVRWASDAPGMAVAVWRTTLAVLLLAPVAGWRIRSDVRAFSWRDVALILGAGVLLGIHFLAWIESLYHTTVASASVLVTTSPIFLVVLGFLVLKERLSWTTVAAICVSVAGAALIGVGDARGVGVGPNPLWGNSLALSASLFASVYLLIGRVVRQQVSWLAYVFPLYSVAALTTLGAAWMQGVPLFGYEAGFYGLCLLMAIGPQILGHGSFNYALHYFPAALVGMLALLEPVGSSALAFVLFGEVPNALAITGMLVVLGAVGVVVWNERQRAPADQER